MNTITLAEAGIGNLTSALSAAPDWASRFLFVNGRNSTITKAIVGAEVGEFISDEMDESLLFDVSIDASAAEFVVEEHAEAKLRLTREILHMAESGAWDDRDSANRAVNSIREALIFLSLFPQEAAVPTASAAGDGVISFEWEVVDRKAMAMFEGDGEYGYAYMIDGRFRPGSQLGHFDSNVPKDLTEYLGA